MGSKTLTQAHITIYKVCVIVSYMVDYPSYSPLPLHLNQRQNPPLNPPQYILMFHHFQILCLGFEQLIRILARLEHASRAGCAGVHL